MLECKPVEWCPPSGLVILASTSFAATYDEYAFFVSSIFSFVLARGFCRESQANGITDHRGSSDLEALRR